MFWIQLSSQAGLGSTVENWGASDRPFLLPVELSNKLTAGGICESARPATLLAKLRPAIVEAAAPISLNSSPQPLWLEFSNRPSSDLHDIAPRVRLGLVTVGLALKKMKRGGRDN